MSEIQDLIKTAVFWRQHAADAAITGTLEVAASTRVTADDAERRLMNHLWDHGRFKDTGAALAKARRLIAQAEAEAWWREAASDAAAVKAELQAAVTAWKADCIEHLRDAARRERE